MDTFFNIGVMLAVFWSSDTEADFSDKLHIFVKRSAISYCEPLVYILDCIPLGPIKLLSFKLSFSSRASLCFATIYLIQFTRYFSWKKFSHSYLAISPAEKTDAKKKFSFSAISCPALTIFSLFSHLTIQQHPWLASCFRCTFLKLFVLMSVTISPLHSFNLFALLIITSCFCCYILCSFLFSAFFATVHYSDPEALLFVCMFALTKI